MQLPSQLIAIKECQYQSNIYIYNILYPLRHWRVREVNVHQTDAYYPRQRLLGRGQAWLHQAGLSEHIHGHAVHDQGNGYAEDILWRGRA